MNIRLFARWTDDPLESPITLDARLTPARRVMGSWTLFGMTGVSPNCRPFLLDANGRMDFGEGRDEAERFWRTDIRDREIALGKTFNVIWSGGDTGVYRIEKIYEPGSKSAAG